MVAVLACAAAALHVHHFLGRTTVMMGDYAKHFITASGMYRGLTQAPSLVEQWRAAVTPAIEYPPGPYLWSCATFRWLGVTGDAAALGQVPWVVVTVLAVYAFVRRQAGIAPGAAAALLVATSPIVSSATIHYAPDVVLMATSFVAVALLASDFRFQDRRVSLVLGVAVGASLLAKWSCLALLAPPLLVTGCAVLRTAPATARWRFLFLLALLVASSVAIPLWSGHDPVPAQAWALAAALPLAVLAVAWLRDATMRPLANLFLVLLVAWSANLGIYSRLAPRLVERLWLQMQIFQEVRIGEGSVMTGMLVCGVFGMSLLLPIGLYHLWLERRPMHPVHVIALAFLGQVAMTAGINLPMARYYAPLVPLVAVLCTWWWPRVPRALQWGLQAVTFTAALLNGILLAMPADSEPQRPPQSQYVRFFTHVDESEDGAISRNAALRTRARGLLSLLQQCVPAGPTILCLVTDNPRDPSLVPPETWEALGAEMGLPLIVMEMGYEDGGMKVKANPWNYFDLSRHPHAKGRTNAQRGLPPDVVLLLCHTSAVDTWATRVAAGTGRKWRVARQVPWGSEGVARLLIPEGEQEVP